MIGSDQIDIDGIQPTGRSAGHAQGRVGLGNRRADWPRGPWQSDSGLA